LEKKFSPTYDAEDLTKIPNYQSVTSILINGVPSSAFSMSLLPPMGQSSVQLRDAIKKLSAVKYGRPRAQVDKEIFARLGAGDEAKKAKLEAMRQAQQARFNNAPSAAGPVAPKSADSGGSSFLDDWLAKRQQIKDTKPALTNIQQPASVSVEPVVSANVNISDPRSIQTATIEPVPVNKPIQQATIVHADTPKLSEPGDKLHIRSLEDGSSPSHEVSIKLR
jgi:hypothetical protein